jgi:hypothetical protein
MKKCVNNMTIFNKISEAQKVKVDNPPLFNIVCIKNETLAHNFHFIPASLSFQMR